MRSEDGIGERAEREGVVDQQAVLEDQIEGRPAGGQASGHSADAD